MEVPARQAAAHGLTASAILQVAEGLRWSDPQLSVALAEHVARAAGDDPRARSAAERSAVLALGRLDRPAEVVVRALPHLLEAERAGRTADAAALRCEIALAAAHHGDADAAETLLEPLAGGRSLPVAVRADALVAWAAARAGRGDVPGVDAAARRMGELPGDGEAADGARRVAVERSRARARRLAGDVSAAAAVLLGVGPVPTAGDGGRQAALLGADAVEVLGELGRVGEAREVGDPLLATPPGPTTAAALGRVRCALARVVHLPAGDLDTAERLAREAEDDLARRDQPAELAEAFEVLAAVAERRGDAADVLRQLRRAHELATSAREEVTRARVALAAALAREEDRLPGAVPPRDEVTEESARRWAGVTPAALGEPPTGHAVVGHAVVGQAVVGQAVVGQAVVGHAVVGDAVVGDAVRGVSGSQVSGAAGVGAGQAALGEALLAAPVPDELALHEPAPGAPGSGLGTSTHAEPEPSEARGPESTPGASVGATAERADAGGPAIPDSGAPGAAPPSAEARAGLSLWEELERASDGDTAMAASIGQELARESATSSRAVGEEPVPAREAGRRRRRARYRDDAEPDELLAAALAARAGEGLDPLSPPSATDAPRPGSAAPQAPDSTSGPVSDREDPTDDAVAHERDLGDDPGGRGAVPAPPAIDLGAASRSRRLARARARWEVPESLLPRRGEDRLPVGDDSSSPPGGSNGLVNGHDARREDTRGAGDRRPPGDEPDPATGVVPPARDRGPGGTDDEYARELALTLVDLLAEYQNPAVPLGGPGSPHGEAIGSAARPTTNGTAPRDRPAGGDRSGVPPLRRSDEAGPRLADLLADAMDVYHRSGSGHAAADDRRARR
ncbi:hypothetical protein [Actinomycetospora cinnamomea]|uniref:Uncharacterized protein n=1 Tax=Actinomycetospora cinnamomea TaxID=663609 RepID=A0A2U1EYT7_9PSEU|nr:hypothetical protein [Actinomycetospora cinnamomea]PVZ04900.1 hypothetical protein C8D89_1164 [Actinomycetospora cinnamomea]